MSKSLRDKPKIPIYDIAIKQGTTFYLKIRLTDSSRPPLPINLTGYTAKLTARTTTLNKPPPLFTLSTENGGLIITPLEGVIELFLDYNLTEQLYQDGVYDFILKTPNDVQRYSIMTGRVIVEACTTNGD